MDDVKGGDPAGAPAPNEPQGGKPRGRKSKKLEELDFSKMTVSQIAAVVRKVRRTDQQAHIMRKIDSRIVKPHNVYLFLDSDDLAEMKEIFSFIDADGSNSIDYHEILEGFREMDLDMDEDWLSRVVSELDKSNEDSIDFQEFTALLFKIRIGLRKAEEQTRNKKNVRRSRWGDDSLCAKLFRCVGNSRQVVWDLFDDPESSFAAKVVATVILTTIVISCILFMLETTAHFQKNDDLLDGLEWFEKISVGMFSLEFVLRVLSCPDIVKFAKSALNWVDLMAIVPFYMEIYFASMVSNVNVDGSSFKVLRLVRIFRVLKIGRYFSGLVVFVDTIESSLLPLGMVFFIVVIGIVTLSSVVYFVEKGTWNLAPEAWETYPPGSTFADSLLQVYNQTGEIVPSKFVSIPATFWYTLSTLTSAGFGFMVPMSNLGKVFAICSALFGILVLAIPISVISSNFKFEYDKMKTKNEIEQEKKLRSSQTAEETRDVLLGNPHLTKVIEDTFLFQTNGNHEHELFASMLYKTCRANQKRIFTELKHRERDNRHHLIEYLCQIQSEYTGTRLVDGDVELVGPTGEVV